MKRQKSTALIISILIICGLFAGCGLAEEQPDVQAYRPEATPTPTPRPTPFEEPVMGQGNSAYVDGTKISTYISEGVVYADFEDFAGAAGVLYEDQAWTFLMGDNDYVLVPESTDFYCNGSKLSLKYPTVKYNQGDSMYVPLESICDKLGMASLEDKDNKCVYYSSYAGISRIPAGYKVPVFSFAGAGLASGVVKSNEIFVREESFADMLELLSSGDYTCITFEQLKDIEYIDNPVILLFDGGYANTYTVVFPLLKKYDIPITLCMATGNIGVDGYLSVAQLKEMTESGLVSLQSSGVSGESMPALSEGELREELEQSRLDIARISGEIPFVITYPEMAATDETMAVAAEYFNYGIRMSGDIAFDTSGEYMNIYRFYTSRDCTDYQLQIWLNTIFN